MPDITMCRNDECPLKEKCYRFIAEPNYRQSYSYFAFDFNLETEEFECEFFYPVKEKESL